MGITAEPGEFNIDPQHVGGLENVLVLEDNDGGHLAGQGIVPFLMCESCGVPGVRRFPTATDVLVIAEDQGLDTVHLDRVDRISNGLWSNVDGWIGGAVPDETQDVSIRHGGTVSLDENSQVKSVLVKTGTSLSLGNHQLAAKETMDFENTIVNIADGVPSQPTISLPDPNSIVTTQGSLVQFNRFTRTPSSTATLAIFNGNVAVGYHTGSDNPVAVTFDPNPISTWNIGGDLTVGHATNTTLEVNNGTWTVGGSASVGGILGKGGGITITNGGRLTVGGNLDVRGSQQQTSRVAVASNSRLDVVGTLSVGSQGIVEFENAAPPAITSIELEGGQTFVRGGPWPTPFRLEAHNGRPPHARQHQPPRRRRYCPFGGWGRRLARGSLLTLKANFTANDVQIHNGPGRKGPSLPNGTIQYFQAGLGGVTRFEGHASAGTSSIRNEGVTEDYYGTGGRTIFAGDSRAGSAAVENFGSTLRTYLAPTAGGATEFRDRASGR